MSRATSRITTLLVVAACFACVGASQATTLDGLAGRRSLTLGPLVLSNFTASDFIGFGPEAIVVEPEAFLDPSGTPLVGVRFSSPVTMGSNFAGPKEALYEIGFDVTVADRDLALDGMTHTTVGNADGSGMVSNVTIALPPGATDVTDGRVTAQRSCLAGRPCPDFRWTPDVSELASRVSAVHVEQTLRMVVGDRGDPGTANLEHFEVLFRLAPGH